MRNTLQHELRKRNPFEFAEQEAYLNILRTADRLSRSFGKLFKDKRISNSQYNVLRILRGAGGEGVPALEVADRLVSRDPDITRLVDRLEKASLVTRSRTARDRRVVLIRITGAGLALLDELEQPVRELHRAQLGHMTPDELQTMSDLLVKARNSTTDSEQAAVAVAQATAAGDSSAD